MIFMHAISGYFPVVDDLFEHIYQETMHLKNAAVSFETAPGKVLTGIIRFPDTKTFDYVLLNNVIQTPNFPYEFLNTTNSEKWVEWYTAEREKIREQIRRRVGVANLKDFEKALSTWLEKQDEEDKLPNDVLDDFYKGKPMELLAQKYEEATDDLLPNAVQIDYAKGMKAVHYS